MEQLQSGRGVPFVIFSLVWCLCCCREKETFFVLKTDKGEVKVLIEEKGFKDFK